MTDLIVNGLLIVSTISISILIIFLLEQNNKSQIKVAFLSVAVSILICCIGQLAQLAFAQRLGIPSIYFDYFVYIGTCFLPVSLLFVSIVFANTRIKLSKKYFLFVIIPIISILVLWTNDLHHLFYRTYSTQIENTVYGSYFPIHTVYSYGCLLFAMISLIVYSIKNTGMFSKQSLLIAVGTLIPLALNILLTFNVMHLSIYITPSSFVIGIMFYAFAIFKFKFLSISPIALQKIVDRMSDGFIVVDENMKIIDYNKTLLEELKIKDREIRNSNVCELISMYNSSKLNVNDLILAVNKTKNNTETISCETYFGTVNKHFNIEINSISNKNSFIGTLILFKDITEHIEDLEQIRANQDMLMEKERLASLGQLIGGIAHNMKTPIMSISGGCEGLSDLVREYDKSIGEPDVTEEDHHEIAKDMQKIIEKIRVYTGYMSDAITAVKGQAVALSEQQPIDFTVEDILRDVDILMKHELKNALINLKTSIKVDKELKLVGNLNGLVQVINNMISNAIQSYNGQIDKDVELSIYKDEREKNLIIEIKDFGSGMNEKVKDKLFKEMITTKGKNGTGLGLFMSYSNIKAKFNGNITFNSEEGKGTSFYIHIPLPKENVLV